MEIKLVRDRANDFAEIPEDSTKIDLCEYGVYAELKVPEKARELIMIFTKTRRSEHSYQLTQFGELRGNAEGLRMRTAARLRTIHRQGYRYVRFEYSL